MNLLQHFTLLTTRMKFPSNSLPSLVLFLFLIASFSLSSAQPAFWFYSCSNMSNYSNSSAFAGNLKALLSNITSDTQLNRGQDHFYTVGTKPGDDLASGAAFCRGDLSMSDCRSCFSDAAGEIRQVCPTQKKAIGWYRDCMFRYSDHPILGTMESSPKFSFANPANASDPEVFYQQLRILLLSLRAKAAAGDHVKYASGSRKVSGSQSVFADMQCTPDLNASACSKCVGDAINYIPTCCYGKTGASVITPNCASRFDVYQFYRSGQDNSSQKGHPIRKRKSSKLSVFIAIPTIMASLLAIGIWICHRWRKAMQTTDHEIEEIIEAESLQFDLNTIKAATCNFSLDNKLGQGGFGEVYKGKLGSGQEVAVKRLSKNSGQGVAEFKTEVVLVAKLQHKNLVKLLGFCMALKEKLLVYEFLPNSSLDRFLFDPTKSTLLDWETRFKIILGIARGLLYLHEDSRLKVIHRDLKSSNILLDESMNPKISDFGLAKLFGMDQTQGDTGRIVGTYGYMAPEYAMTGHFSAKSDVYSFGMIVLEILTAQKNGHFARPEAEEPLVYRAWRLWNEEKVLDLLDPSLGNKYEPEEVKRCIHIGLLSIQEDPVRRPRMTTVVAVLNGDSINLPMPKAPQFLGNPTSFGDETTTSYPCTMTVNITDLHPR